MFSAYHATLPNPIDQAAAQAASGEKNYITGSALAESDASRPEPVQQTNAASQGAAAAAATQPGSNTQPARQNATTPDTQQNSLHALSSSETNSNRQIRYYPAGERFSESQFPIGNEILRTAPSIDWSYAVIERTDPHTLATTLIPFSLGQAVLDRNPSQNLELEPGDVLTIFSTADIHVPQSQQVKYVELEGEVAHAGIYSVNPGETLRDVVQRAGGLTPGAYLYGSEFLRESTQRMQQARLNDYVNSLDREIQLGASNATGSLVNATAAAALSTSVQSQRSLVVTLRHMRATGRIVLGLNPYSRGVEALPNLPLQDGDRFVVPTTPATVNVVGAVYDQNSFLFARGRHVADYLKVAGGGTRNADKRHEFVIRADGSVVSKATSGGTVFGGGFDNRLAYPGDTVVVPDNINKTTVLRGLTDWSTVFSQFGLGIATLTLLGL